MKKLFYFFAILMALYSLPSLAQGDPSPTVNMDRYITLTVQSGKDIMLNFKAAQDNTPVRIVSGTNTQNITVGTNRNNPSYTVTSDGTTMTIYGDIVGFSCSENGNNITSLDVSKNIELTELEFANNGVSSINLSNNTKLASLDCSSNAIASLDLKNNTQLISLNCSDNLLTTLDVSYNTELNSIICYKNQFTTDDINSIYCSLPDRANKEMGQLFILNNTNDFDHENAIASNADNALLRNWIVKYYNDGNNQSNVQTIGVNICNQDAKVITIHTNASKYSGMSVNFKAAKNNTPIMISNGSTVSKLVVNEEWFTQPTIIATPNTTVKIYGDITSFKCEKGNKTVKSIDVSKNNMLKELISENNFISSIDISQNTELEKLTINSSSIDILDLSNNTKLNYVDIRNNNFNTASLNSLYCSLPTAPAPNAVVYILDNANSQANAELLQATSQNARDKGWKVQYFEDKAEVQSNGSYSCIPKTLNRDKYITLTVKPNVEIHLFMTADEYDTPVLIEGGTNKKETTVGAGNINKYYTKFASTDETIKVYGDIVEFAAIQNTTNLTALDVRYNTALKNLYCFDNNISALDLSNNINLEVLECNNNKISDINLTQCTKLKKLRINDNKLSTIDLSKNTQLTLVNCSYNQLTSIDLSKNTDLTELYCHNNSISTIDLYKNTELQWLAIMNNQLTSLDISQNTKLQVLWCYGNNFSTEAIDNIFCSLNDREVQENGFCFPLNHNTDKNSEYVLASNADNARAKNWSVRYFNNGKQTENNVFLPLNIETTGSYTCGSEVNMYRYITLKVVPNKTIKMKFRGTNERNFVKVTSGNKEQHFTAGMYLNKEFSFTTESDEMMVYGDITGFDCSGNGDNIKGVDIHNNYDLEELDCSANAISDLYVNRNTLLKKLDCSANKIEYLHIDGIRGLDTLICFGNAISELDISANRKLRYAICSNNILEKIELNNPMLTHFEVNNNRLTSLDLSRLRSLDTIDCSSNSIPYINFTTNTELRVIKCFDNPFTSGTADDLYCDLPTLPKKVDGYLYMISKEKPEYTKEILASNATNATKKNWKVAYFAPKAKELELIITTGKFICGSKPNLARHITFTSEKASAKCKLKLSGAKAETNILIENGNSKKEYAIKKEGTTIDLTLTNKQVKLYGDITKFEYTSAGKLTELDVTNNTILESINCKGNKLTTLNLKENLSLSELDCADNMLNTLSLGENVRLSKLYCQNNKIAELDLSNCNSLSELSCQENELATLDANDKLQLTKLECYKNKLTSLRIHNAPQLSELVCTNNKLTKLDISTNIKLRDLICADNEIASIDATNNLELTTLTAYNNKITEVNITNCKALARLYINNNLLTSLDVSKNAELTLIYCDNNKLSTLDASNCPELIKLYADKNTLSSLNVSKNPALQRISVASNVLNKIDLSGTPKLESLNINNNILSELNISNNPKLTELFCGKNLITSLDFTDAKSLTTIACYGNPFTRKGVDSIYCSLPENTAKEVNRLFMLFNESDANKDTVLASNSDNAKNKKWNVLYFDGYTDKETPIVTVGKYICGSKEEEEEGGDTYVEDNNAFGISIFPNPATSKVQIKLSESVNETLILVDLTGRAVLLTDVISGEATIDVSNLTAGTYFLRIGNRVQKLTVK